MTSRPLVWHPSPAPEDLRRFLSDLVVSLGGAKKVGASLFDGMRHDAAARRLLDAINPDRTQQLSPVQFLMLLRWGRQVGYHDLMSHIADEAGYTRPSPRSPEEERADLQRQVIEMGKQLEQLARRLQK